MQTEEQQQQQEEWVYCAQSEERWLRSEIVALRKRAASLQYIDAERMEQIVAACTMMELQMDLDALQVSSVAQPAPINHATESYDQPQRHRSISLFL